MTPKQEQYLAELARTGSAVHARRAVGITRRQVSNWEADEAFAEAAAEAQELANAEILAKARAQAMAGDTSLLGVWMRALIPALRPQSSVNVGVQVDSRRQHMTPDELWAKVEKIREERIVRGEILPDNPDDPRWRQIGVGSVVDVEPVLGSLPAPEPVSGPEIDPEELV